MRFSDGEMAIVAVNDDSRNCPLVVGDFVCVLWTRDSRPDLFVNLFDCYVYKVVDMCGAIYDCQDRALKKYYPPGADIVREMIAERPQLVDDYA